MTTTTPNGSGTFVADGALAKGDIVAFNNGKAKKNTTATAVAFGVALDSAADGEIVPVAILGSYTGTVQVKATAAVTQGAHVDSAGGVGAANDMIVGVALQAASASGELIEVAHCVPGKLLG